MQLFEDITQILSVDSTKSLSFTSSLSISSEIMYHLLFHCICPKFTLKINSSLTFDHGDEIKSETGYYHVKNYSTKYHMRHDR